MTAPGSRPVWLRVLVAMVWGLVGLVVLAGLAMAAMVVLMGGCPDCPADPPEPSQPHRHATPGGGVVALSAGGDLTCAKTVDGPEWCWGDGAAPYQGAAAPTRVWSEHRLGRCVVDADHLLRCERRQAAPRATSRLEPWFELPAVRTVVMGAGHGCAIRDDASLWCFGANESGQVSAPSPPWVAAPTQTHEHVQEVAIGRRHTCALVDAGRVECWGDDSSGQVGRLTASRSAERALAGPARAVVAADERSCALLTDGAVWCWGRFNTTYPGYPPPATRAPERVELGGSARALAGSAATICALVGDDAVVCWGHAYRGEHQGDFGPDPDDGSPRRLELPGRVLQIVVGDDHACVLLKSGSVSCVGSNRKLQLGAHLRVEKVVHPIFHAEDRCPSVTWDEPTGLPDFSPMLWWGVTLP